MKASEHDAEEEDDYMSVAFLASSPPQKQPESSLARTKRLRQEAAARSQQLSKPEREAQAREQRQAALAKSLENDADNKGLAMMRRLGFKPGETLGKSGNGLTAPIAVEQREGREGIGKDGERKKRMREEYVKREEGVKRAKVSEEEYVERVRREREEQRLEGQVKEAMKVAEGLDEERGDEGGVEEGIGEARPDVVSRGLKREKERKEHEEWDRRRGFERETRLPEYAEDEEDEEGGAGLGAKARKLARTTSEEDEEDEELDEFERLPVSERLQKVVQYMRDKHWYCFWCKMQYDQPGLPGCPGLIEEEHD